MVITARHWYSVTVAGGWISPLPARKSMRYRVTDGAVLPCLEVS